MAYTCTSKAMLYPQDVQFNVFFSLKTAHVLLFKKRYVTFDATTSLPLNHRHGCTVGLAKNNFQVSKLNVF